MIPVDERIMAWRLKHTFGFASLIAVYAPTEVCKLSAKEVLYAKPTSVVDKCPQRDIHIVLGCDQAGYKMFIGPHGSGNHF